MKILILIYFCLNLLQKWNALTVACSLFTQPCFISVISSMKLLISLSSLWIRSHLHHGIDFLVSLEWTMDDLITAHTYVNQTWASKPSTHAIRFCNIEMLYEAAKFDVFSFIYGFAHAHTLRIIANIVFKVLVRILSYCLAHESL